MQRPGLTRTASWRSERRPEYNENSSNPRPFVLACVVPVPLPIRHLPVVQNWDCHACGTCCHEYHVFVTEDERKRIESQGWEKEPDLADVPLFVAHGPPWARRYRLNQRTNGACIFLNDAGRCRIHERFGGHAKPLPCQLYPFVLIPAGDHWRVGMRFSCPSSAGNKGRSVKEHQEDLTRYAAELQEQAPGHDVRVPAPSLQRGQSIDWDDLLRFVRTFVALLQDQSDRFERRMRKLAAFVHLCRQARFDEVKGPRLEEFLGLVAASVDGEVPLDPASVSPPSWIGRVLFRQALAVYGRKDRGPFRGEVRSRRALLRAACKFVIGKGAVPRLHAWMPATTFAQPEIPTGPLPRAAEEVLERYYATKVSSLQFCGPVFYDYPFWEGLQALCLTFPVVLWLARALADLPKDEAVTRAIGMVDYNFGYNPILGTERQRLSLAILARFQELDRLMAWYSR
jgi:lysine-N-methylase